MDEFINLMGRIPLQYNIYQVITLYTLNILQCCQLYVRK